MKRKKKSPASQLLSAAMVLLAALAFLALRQAGSEDTGARSEASIGSSQERETLSLRNIVATGQKGRLIEHKGYTLSYNVEHNTPDWVAWELTAAESESDAVDRKDFSFIADDDLPYESQVTTADYTHSGYDRGHMCPAADMKWDSDAMHDCFYMSNICPQVPVVNQQYWERLENACRRWAVSEGAIYVVCGPVYTSAKPKHIGHEHMVAVPDAFYKVVVSLSPGREKGIGFYYANAEERQTMESAARPIDEIETLTGFDFFPELQDDIEDHIESTCDLRAWR